MSDLNLDNRFDTEIDQGVVNEGTAYRVAPTGGYNVQLELQGKRIGEDSARPWEFDRAATTYRAPILAMTDDDRTVKIGSCFIEVSHETRRMENGDLDRMSQRYSQLVKALQDVDALPKEKVTNPMVEEAALNTPVHIFITESFKIPSEDGGWKWTGVRRPEDNETIKSYKEQGYSAKNFCVRISKYRMEE